MLEMLKIMKKYRTSARDFEQVWKNLEYAVSYRSEQNLSTALGVQSLILPDNLSSLPELAQEQKTTD